MAVVEHHSPLPPLLLLQSCCCLPEGLKPLCKAQEQSPPPLPLLVQLPVGCPDSGPCQLPKRHAGSRWGW